MAKAAECLIMEPTECPRCESPQRFVPRKRCISNVEDILEVFIACSKCNYQQIVDHTTYKIEQHRSTLRKLELQAKYQRDRHDSVNGATIRAISMHKTRLRGLRSALHKRMQEAGIEQPTY